MAKRRRNRLQTRDSLPFNGFALTSTLSSELRVAKIPPMSFAALRRLRRKFGVPNATKVVEARRFLEEELVDMARTRGSQISEDRDRIPSLVRAAGLDSQFSREVLWAGALGDRARLNGEPSDTEIDRFFDALERLYGAELSEPVEPRSLIGRVVGDRYRIEMLVGEGAAGVVYRARHVETDAPVAIKVLHPSKVLRREIVGELEHPRKFWDELVARFRREARAAANVSHPGIVSVFDFGTEGAGFYQAMEFLEGETLKDAIAREAPMPFGRAVRMIRDTSLALDAAHARGVIHRDLKPANIFLCRFDWGESVKVLDFGIAKMLREAEEEATRLTETGVFLGTYRYASPEQCLGDIVGPESDVYALGVILFEMLSARPPFDGPSSVLAIKHATVRAPRLDEFRTDLPEELVELVDASLAKQPADRPQRAADFALRLSAFAEGTASSPLPARRPAQRAIPADAFAMPESAPPGRSRTAAAGAPPALTARGGSRAAQDFAAMLVHELLDFFPEAVAGGLAGSDIYRRLHDEIDVRWSLYAQRHADEPTDHFYELLVAVVARGDAAKLGPGLPDSTTQRRRRRKR